MDNPKNIRRRRWPWYLLALGVAGTSYVLLNPLVFNESFMSHAHCIKGAGLEFQNYAVQNGGAFPTHPRGYGDALLLLDKNIYYTLTGPGYDDNAFQLAKKQGTPLAEKDCGRVYIQGLNKTANPKIAILFDKVSTPGGDHCHLLARLSAPFGREVLFVAGYHEFIPDSDWPTFVQTQLALLPAAGIPPEEAQRLYDSAKAS